MQNYLKQQQEYENQIAIIRQNLKNGKTGLLFNNLETKELLDMLDSGGYFLKVMKDPNSRVLVLKEEDEGFELLGALSKTVSSKIYNIYSEPSPIGYSVLSLKSFIAKNC